MSSAKKESPLRVSNNFSFGDLTFSAGTTSFETVLLPTVGLGVSFYNEYIINSHVKNISYFI